MGGVSARSQCDLVAKLAGKMVDSAPSRRGKLGMLKRKWRSTPTEILPPTGKTSFLDFHASPQASNNESRTQQAVGKKVSSDDVLESIKKDWTGLEKGPHIDFNRDEEVPLQKGQYRIVLQHKGILKMVQGDC